MTNNDIPDSDALREELHAEQLRDFYEIVAAENARPHRDMTVDHILDWMLDLYDRDEFATQKTWDLINELVVRIPPLRRILVDYSRIGHAVETELTLLSDEREGLVIGDLVTFVGDSVPDAVAQIISIDGAVVGFRLLK